MLDIRSKELFLLIKTFVVSLVLLGFTSKKFRHKLWQKLECEAISIYFALKYNQKLFLNKLANLLNLELLKL